MTQSYNLPCPIAQTLDIVGERWTMLILRDLLRDGPQRYHDLMKSLKGIGPNTLSSRLKTLESNGLIERHFYEQHPPRAKYKLTAKGRKSGIVIKALWALGKEYVI